MCFLLCAMFYVVPILIRVNLLNIMTRVALITGGSRGIGYGIAKQLAQNGFDLAINGLRDDEAVSDAMEDLRKAGSNVLYCQGDVSLSNDRKKIVQPVKDHFGKLHVLVNN